jgi:hypothetical protein
MTESVRIFVGCPANNEDLECQAVLDYSLRKRASQPLDITWMMLSRDPESFWFSDPRSTPRRGWNTKTWATPFSPLRWGIPAACNYEGKAIYMDCDQIALADIADLWNQPIPDGRALLMKGAASCVMLMDCAAMKPLLPEAETLKSTEGLYRTVRKSAINHSAPFKGDWNCLDGNGHKSIYDGDVKVLHYTHIPTQPNHRHARARLKREGKPHWYPGPDQKHPRAEVTELFDTMLAEAVAAGRGPEAFRVSPEFGEYAR